MKTQTESNKEQRPLKVKRVKLHHYGHPRALFCSRACREGFKSDRQSGLIYGPYFLTDLNRFAMCAEEASAIAKFCPYCNAHEGDETTTATDTLCRSVRHKNSSLKTTTT